MSGQAIIFIVEDDASVRRALERVMLSAGHESRAFASAEEFISGARLSEGSCIVADMTMMGMSGLDLKHLLNAAHSDLPLIFLTAEDSEEMRTSAREAGAVGCFRKPVDTQALLDAVQWALTQPRPSPSV
jgi:FixJ family two-component response regulator